MTSLVLGFLLVSAAMLGLRWHRLSERVPLDPTPLRTATPSASAEECAPQVKAQEKPPARQTRINLNTATKEQLVALPGIGETLAERILADRNANGPFGSIQDIMRVSGIGEKKLAALRPMVFVE